jgi:hypothetical protein
MQLIDLSIQSTALLSLLWLTAEFIRFTSRRGSGRRVAPAVETCQHCNEPAVDRQLCQKHLNELMTEEFFADQPDRPAFKHVVVAFKRPATRPHPTDRELIQLAKQIGYSGAKKWSFNRKLSQSARTDLLRYWATAAN